MIRFALGAALLLLVIIAIADELWPPAPPLLVEVAEPDMTPAAAPFCTIPGPPKPLERANPLEIRSLA